MSIDEMKGKPLTISLVKDNPAHAELVQRSLENHQMADGIYLPGQEVV